MDFNDLWAEVNNEAKQNAVGRPKGSGTGKKAQRTKKKEEEELLLHPKIGEVKTVYRIKYRDHKNPWEEEKEFYENFKNFGLPVRESSVLEITGRMIAYNDSGDITYQPY